MKTSLRCIHRAVMAIGGLTLMTLPAHAAWVLLDNFESYTPGSTLAGQGGWTLSGSSLNNSTVVVDPTNAGNQVASMSSSTGLHTIYRSLGANEISNTSTATVFFRAYSTTNNPNFNLGLLNQAAPTNANFAANQSQLRIGSDSAVGNNNLYAREGLPGANNFVDIGDFEAATWYNFWLVVDNVNDRTTFYASTGLDDAAVLGSASGYSFRTGSTDPIVTLQAITSTVPVLMDDLYIDNAGVNLINPIPEPSVAALTGLAALGLLRRRRR